MARFGCSMKTLTNNAHVFKSSKFIIFCQKFNIIVAHSITYYPHGNILAESSNKMVVRILKKKKL